MKEIITVSPWIPLWKWTSEETGVEMNKAGSAVSLTLGDIMGYQRHQVAGNPSIQPKDQNSCSTLQLTNWLHHLSHTATKPAK